MRCWILVSVFLLVCFGVMLTYESAINQSHKQKIEIANTNQFNLVYIPSGKFIMGNHFGKEDTPEQKPIREVTVEAFKIMTHEVTFAQYDKFAIDTNRKLPDDEGWGRGSRPVINVSWRDAVDFSKWLSITNEGTYRLPSEAEWEYACLGNAPFDIYCGQYTVDSIAWYGLNSNGKSHKAGTKLPNEMGLYDMSGNVSEWVRDCWNVNYRFAANDASARETGDCSKRVVRGGSWKNNAYYQKASVRSWSSVNEAYNTVGFRLVEEIEDANE